MSDTESHQRQSSSTTSESLCVCLLASGSRGNCIYISNGIHSILIDAGLSGVEFERRMRAKGLSPEAIDAVVVSHEHNDHIHGVGILSRRYRIPVYATPQTYDHAAHKLGRLETLNPFECGRTFHIGTFEIHPFAISHDAEDPSGFTIRHQNHTIGIATDLGIATSMVKAHLRTCDLLILEANHDEKLLENGPYPWPLKQRVKSRLGHLSNEASKQLLMDVRHDRLSHVILAHLSQQNNTPRHALREVGQALHQSRTQLAIADQDSGSDLYYLK